MKAKRTTFLLIQDCTSKAYTSDNQRIVREALSLDVVKWCGRCSGGIVAGSIHQVFHPSAHLTAEQIATALI